MNQTVHNRELFMLEVLGARLQGTYHRAAAENSARLSGQSGGSRIGVLILNGLSAMRSAKGESAVYWADAIAEKGYPVFRLDLTGYGDSSGELPADQLGFINGGGFAAVASAAIDKLAARFKLSGVVLVAHCSGTVSAIYTAGINRKCKGVALMDPYFHLPRTKAPKLRRILHAWALQTGVERRFIRVYERWKQQWLSYQREALPENANLLLLRSWKTVAASEVPVLILKRAEPKSSEGTQRTVEFDYLAHILQLPGQKGQVIAKTVDGAHHSFANRQGREMVRQHIVQWLEGRFPISHGENSAARVVVSSEVVGGALTAETMSGV